MDREIWFEKLGWSYVPCHWKGFAVMAVFIVPAAAAILLVEWALDAFGYRDADWLPFLVFFLPAWLSLLVIAKRHS